MVLSGHVQDAIHVDIEDNLDLRYTRWGWRDVRKFKLSQLLVVLRQGSLPLVDLDVHVVLAVLSSSESLRPTAGHRSTLLNERNHHATAGTDPQSQAGHVDEDHLLDLTSLDATLQASAQGNNFIRVHRTVRVLPRKVLHKIVDRRHTCATSDKDDLVNVFHIDLSILENRLHRTASTLQQVTSQVFKFGATQFSLEGDRGSLIYGKVRKTDVRLVSRGEFLLRVLSGFSDTAHSREVIADILPGLILERLDDPIGKCSIPVIATKFVVTCRGLDLDVPITNFKK